MKLKPLDIPIIVLTLLWALQLNVLAYTYGWYIIIPVIIITFLILLGMLVLIVRDIKYDK